MALGGSVHGVRIRGGGELDQIKTLDQTNILNRIMEKLGILSKRAKTEAYGGVKERVRLHRDAGECQRPEGKNHLYVRVSGPWVYSHHICCQMFVAWTSLILGVLVESCFRNFDRFLCSSYSRLSPRKQLGFFFSSSC